MKCGVVLAAALVAILSLGSIAAADLRISPEMELLAGVLTQTSWMDNRGPQGPGNEYFRALKAFFAGYKEHKAVAIAEEFSKTGFTFDAPPAFICHLGPLPGLELAYEYSDYLIGRAGGREKLEEFRLALIGLARESNFLEFFAQWEPYLDESLAPSREGFREDVLTEWLQEFFGWSAGEFHLIMAPSMFPGGGYGANATDQDGRMVVFQIIRENGSSSDRPEFPTSTNLELLTIHELGHSFVNPSLEAYPERAKAVKPLMWPVREIMKQQAYPTVSIFLNEQVLRGVEVIAARELYGPEMEAWVIANNEEWGFYLTRFVAEQLQFYQANRDVYPTFREFVPHLFDQLEAYQAEHSRWDARLFGRFLR
ncbi:MAG TPA: DUF4932 domain-containing protein [Firmicutes bacterium]|nr:MAG: hypothetical protein AA931_06165 [Peptococcaceae bacterium 1109]HHT72228.1 DUF4932 domain-containing protein [Bacillota bacterium]